MDLGILKLNNHIYKNYGFLDELDEYKSYLFVKPNKTFSSSDKKATQQLVSFLQDYLNKYIEYNNKYFIPCDQHKDLTKHNIIKKDF